MVGIAEALTAATAAFGLAKQIVSVDHELDKASLKLKAAELMEALATTKAGLVDAREELREKDVQLARLKETMTQHAATVQHEGYMYDARENGKPIGLPYCPRCWTKDQVLMKLIGQGYPYGEENRALMNTECPQCRVPYRPIAVFLYSNSSRW